MPSSLPMAHFRVLEGALKEARAPVCGADSSGQHQEFSLVSPIQRLRQGVTAT